MLTFNLKIAGLAFGTGLAVAANTVAASATTLSDGDFTSVTLTSSFAGDPGTTITPSAPCSSCGNPSGAGLQVIFNYTNSTASGAVASVAAVGFVDNLLSYIPAVQGAISTITASGDKILTIAGSTGQSGNTFRPMIEQDGKFYLAPIPGASFPAPGSTGYLTFLQSGLTASSFLLFDFATGTFGSANPDFAGDPILFGVGQVSTFFEGAIVTVGFDNLSFDVAQTPLPAAFPLFATGVAGLGLLGWRRKRKQHA
jgi:hypothetical protein